MLNSLKPVHKARKSIKRLGRGPGSGLGKTCGRGHKGQLARSGGKTRVGFEGGQTPFFQRIPKQGFYNVNKKKYSLVNLEDLEIFENDTLITPKLLMEHNKIKKNNDLIKILAKGNLTKRLIVQAVKFSKKAEEAIIKSGGKIQFI
ncbi:50S ribosomal protein L15 ['Opuntia sp.' phytoplasma]|uniref:Large ribosomal subunit protein uL15 n=1 Tax=Candidatus Phytoplasma asiaticum TaxID=2763338 RepID=A0AAX3B9S5_9MOLU|nr:MULTISPECIES: 50S ribosomal protein L15 [Phytoplasma]MDO8053942.1 50S ribosomal protein L15 ['Opuntia sp.' phytoplasma]MDO8057679.1 50S ribosomal protein L15 ['Opuntia sp.' phytoplasma]UQV27376.1 50S ribosomal protein L15 ['Parthenium hysterophorus' phyllody phytoplasma]